MNYRPFNGFSHAAKLLRPFLTTPLVLLIFQLILSQQHNQPQPIGIIEKSEGHVKKKKVSTKIQKSKNMINNAFYNRHIYIIS